MAQNIYDDEQFFAAYARLQRSVGGLDAAPEWPTVRALLPDLTGRRVLDLGCGYGWFCRWAAAEGASEVLGLDVSERMLARACADTAPGSPISYERHDLDDLQLSDGTFDLAFSSLTIHYLDDLRAFFTRVRRSLADGGRLVCTGEHPLMTAPRHPRFVDGPHGGSVWPLDGYLDERERVTDWLVPGVVKHHRTVETHVRALLDAGFVLTDLIEWGPDERQVAERPEWRIERARPHFLVLGADARGAATGRTRS